jgi:DNA-binding MurR/RpiR family transcriptional regulator
MPAILELVQQAAAAASPSLSRVGQWMAAHPIQTVSHSAEEIAALTGTSVAAVNRFSRAAGFEGFAVLKTAWGRELQSVIDPVRKLSAQAGNQTRRGSGAAGDWAAIDQAVASAPIEKVAGKLLKARQVWVAGLGMTSHIAAFAADGLEPYARQVRPLTGAGGIEQVLRHMLGCGPGDVLLAITLPRYSRDIARLAAVARERGAHVVAMTDQREAPLAQVAHSVLLAPASHALLASSALGVMALIEALTAAVMRLNPEAQRVARELSDAVLEQLDTSASTPSINPNSKETK